MTQRVAILGSGTSLPFLGHLSGQVSNEQGTLSFAARVNLQSDPTTCFQCVRRIEADLRMRLSEIIETEPDIHNWIRALWMFWMVRERAEFGPELGADLSVVFYIQCHEQEAISASGVTSIWGLVSQSWYPVVKGEHPMLGLRGVPESYPGVFQLARTSSLFVASPAPDILNELNDAQVRARLGRSYGE
jgi:hypothetical protein